MNPSRSSFIHDHSLSLTSVCVLITWIVLYVFSDPSTHWGSFFGNAIADWSGVVVGILATKYLYEKGSAESRQPEHEPGNRILCLLEDHSLTIFLGVTGLGWILLFRRMDANSKWGQVIGNVVSEWTQLAALVLLTKKLLERGSKESRE